VGDYFYVVEEGDFEITVNGEHVGDVEGGGGTFGELALMHNSPRAATIVAKNSALLWGLDRNTFRCTLAATAMNGLDEIKEFLGKVEILEGLDPSQMSTLAQAVDVQKWSKGEMIVRKGEVGNEM
jgi:CRP-like cAMP-binding protein